MSPEPGPVATEETFYQAWWKGPCSNPNLQGQQSRPSLPLSCVEEQGKVQDVSWELGEYLQVQQEEGVPRSLTPHEGESMDWCWSYGDE